MSKQESKCEHRCECEHERVKYCRKCKVVHCLDCKTEWVAPATGGWYQPYWYQAYATQNANAYNGTLTTTGTYDLNQNAAATTVCSHT